MSVQSASEFRVRFAPSPTGYLHVGGARTALYNYLFAKKNNGKFILRIEDTDAERSSEESLRGMIDDLVWLGLKWDEGVDPVTLKDMGSFHPYRQSQRLQIYQEVAQQLLKEGKAYYCFLTDEEIEKQRQELLAEGGQPHIKSPYQNWSYEQALTHKMAGHRGVVRFKTQGLNKDYLLQDLIRGEVRFPSDMVGDFVLLRSDGMPVYNFCCVVDDHMMKMSHILRAEEHLPNTLRQMMIYEAMNWSLPKFGHLSLILDDDRQKLSKRKGAVACGQFKESGYLPEAILNFILLLGWSHPEEKEILSVEDMIQAFTTERFHLSGAIFDRVKLKWMNSMHLRAKSDRELWGLIVPFLDQAKVPYQADIEWQNKSVQVFKNYMEVLTDAVGLYQQLDDQSFQIHEDAQEALGWESTRVVLNTWKELIQNTNKDFLTEEEFLKIQDEVKVKANVKGKNLFMPIRVAVIGKPHGTELKILVPLLQTSSLIDRVSQVIAKRG